MKIGFLNFTFIDLIDITLVTVLLYQVYKLLKDSVAVKIVSGLVFIYLFYLIVNAVEMELLSTILGQFIGVGVILAVILFQQEIRKFLLLIGRTTEWKNVAWLSFLSTKNTMQLQGETDINVVVKAAKELSLESTGALIAVSRGEELKNYVETGDLIDAVISKRLLVSIFNKYSPLHDGAVILSNGRITAARCILPVTENDNIPASYGLRHRASLGLTEVTDSMVIIVSEETGNMSLAHNGIIHYNLSTAELRSRLIQYLHPDEKKVSEQLAKKELKVSQTQ